VLQSLMFPSSSFQHVVLRWSAGSHETECIMVMMGNLLKRSLCVCTIDTMIVALDCSLESVSALAEKAGVAFTGTLVVSSNPRVVKTVCW
jgi:hypothetical protein